MEMHYGRTSVQSINIECIGTGCSQHPLGDFRNRMPHSDVTDTTQQNRQLCRVIEVFALRHRGAFRL